MTSISSASPPDHTETQKEDRILSLDNLGLYTSQLKSSTPNQSQKKKFSRTPSGNILTNQVQSVKVFFSPTQKNHVEKSNEKIHGHNHDEVLSTNEGVQSSGTPMRSNQSEQRKNDLSECLFNHDDQRRAKPLITSASKKRKINSNSSEESVESQSSEKMPDQRMDIDKSSEASQEDMDIQKLICKYGIEESATSIDVRTVLAMFQNMKQIFSSKLSRDEHGKYVGKIKTMVETEVNGAMKQYEEKIHTLERDLRNSNRKARILEDVVRYNSDLLQDVTKRLDSLELANAQKAAILTGCNFQAKKADKIKEILAFFQQELKVFTRIEDAYTLGTGENAPCVIIFQTMDDNNVVFENKAKLKDISKDSGRNIFINHYLPSKENEKKKRERKIKADLKYSTEENKPDAEHAKGGLKIGSEVYRRKVNPPNPTDLIDYTVEELDEILQMKMLKGPEIRRGNSLFLPYAIDAGDFESIRKAYMKLRLIHTKAKHIVCAYHLPGPDAQKHINSDSCDDNEYGVGAFLLKEMIKSDLFNKAIYIIRYSGQQKLEQNRMEAYLQAAKGLLKQKPYNEILGKKQAFEEKEEVAQMKRHYQYKERTSTTPQRRDTASKTHRNARK